jgi:CBS domain-containing protein
MAQRTVADNIQGRSAIVVNVGTSLADALALCREHDIHRLPVVGFGFTRLRRRWTPKEPYWVSSASVISG